MKSVRRQIKIRKYTKEYLQSIQENIDNFKTFLYDFEKIYYNNATKQAYAEYLNQNFKDYDREELKELRDNPPFLFIIDYLKFCNPECQIFYLLNTMTYENLMLLSIPLLNLCFKLRDILDEESYKTLYNIYLSIAEIINTSVRTVESVSIKFECCENDNATINFQNEDEEYYNKKIEEDFQTFDEDEVLF